MGKKMGNGLPTLAPNLDKMEEAALAKKQARQNEESEKPGDDDVFGGSPMPVARPRTTQLSATDEATKLEEKLNSEQRRQVNSIQDEKPDSAQEKLNLGQRTLSLNAPSPVQQFGKCGGILKNSAMYMDVQDPGSQQLTWYQSPMTVLVIKKAGDPTVTPHFFQMVQWFVRTMQMVVFVEAAIMDDPLLTQNQDFNHIKDKLVTFTQGKDDLTDKIDFIVTLGGDGTLLYAASLFQESVPPVMAFHMGSLGFLTPFEIDNFEQKITHVLQGHAALTLRSRLQCNVMYKQDKADRSTDNTGDKATTADRTTEKAKTNLVVLNEVVIDRGTYPYLSNMDLFLDGKLITTVQGDGFIVSTPTGSTAYAASAGASMIHPSVPAIMVTPICPHSLSFRPIVVPAGVELKITVSPDSRNTAWVSFDGRKRQELMHGDSLHVTTSIYPVPSICSQDQISDWFASLAECLHWNVRKKQKHFDELSDLTRVSSDDTLDSLDKSEQS